MGSFTNIRGGHVYPSLIRSTPPKPIRVFLQDGTSDLDNDRGNWWLANQEMASALRYKHYDYKFVGGTGRHSGKHGGAILPDSLRWLWRTAGPADSCFLFSYFIGNGEDGLHLARSSNGYMWEALGWRQELPRAEGGQVEPDARSVPARRPRRHISPAVEQQLGQPHHRLRLFQRPAPLVGAAGDWRHGARAPGAELLGTRGGLRRGQAAVRDLLVHHDPRPFSPDGRHRRQQIQPPHLLHHHQRLQILHAHAGFSSTAASTSSTPPCSTTEGSIT